MYQVDYYIYWDDESIRAESDIFTGVFDCFMDYAPFENPFVTDEDIRANFGDNMDSWLTYGEIDYTHTVTLTEYMPA